MTDKIALHLLQLLHDSINTIRDSGSKESDFKDVRGYAKEIYQTLTGRKIVKSRPLGNVPAKRGKKKILGMHVDRDDLSAAELDEIDEQYAPKYGWIVAREVFDGDELEYFQGMLRQGRNDTPLWTPLLREAEVFYDRSILETKLKVKIGRSSSTRVMKVMEEYVGMGHYGAPILLHNKPNKRNRK